MKQILTILTIVLCVCAGFILLSWFVEVDSIIDPRSPPADVQPGRYSHQITKTETWSNFPIASKERGGENGGTEAASIERPAPKRLTTDRTDGTDTTVPERSSPPPSPYIGERIPFWYEHERTPGEPYEAPPTPTRRGGLFRRRSQ